MESLDSKSYATTLNSSFESIRNAENIINIVVNDDDDDDEDIDGECDDDDYSTMCGLVLLCAGFIGLMLFLLIYLN